MRTRVFLLTFICAFLIVSCSPKKDLDINLSGVNVSNINLSILKGKVILINIFQTDCLACQEEMPSLVKLYNKYKQNPNFALIGISLDSNNLKAFISNFHVNYPVYTINENDLSKLGGIAYTPTTILIDRQGNIMERFVGYRDYYFLATNINILIHS